MAFFNAQRINAEKEYKSMSKTAIVIGATGLVGSAVVDHLASAAHISKIVTITRRVFEHVSEKVENHVIGFEQLGDYAELFCGDMLFSCLGTTIAKAGSIQAQRVIDLDYQAIAARLAVEQGVEHYLLVSSSGADVNSFSAYLKMKGELENRVQELPFPKISIFQPSLLLGKREDKRTAESFGSLLMPAVCKLPGLRRYRPIKGSQVAEKMVSVSAQQSSDFKNYKLDQVFPV